jgi:phenylacetate-CoA ligase
MSAWLTTLYDAAPASVKRLFMNGYALYLHQLREGAPMVSAMETIDRIDRAGRAAIDDYHLDRVNELLSWVDERVPFYKGRALVGSAPGGRLATLGEMTGLPILTKSEVRTNQAALIAAGVKTYYGHTSGTTGSPLQVWYDRGQLTWNRAAEKVMRSRAGVAPDDRVAVIWGRAIVQRTRRRPPYWMVNDADRELWLSAFHVGRGTSPLYFDAIRRYRAVALETYPSLAYVLAKLAIESGEKIKFKTVMTSSETLFPFQREIIQEAFGAEVFDFYGVAERVAFAVECKRHDGPHLLESFGYVEPTPASAAGTGHALVATGLTNRAMPLIRYAMGDVTTVVDKPCACGLTSRRLAPVTSKQEDVLVTPDGRFVSPSILTHPFKPLVGVLRSQIIQERVDELIVRLETDANFDVGQEVELTRALVDRMGPGVDIRIVKEPVFESSGGKFRWVVSRVKGMHQLVESSKAGGTPSGSRG